MRRKYAIFLLIYYKVFIKKHYEIPALPFFWF